MNFWEVVLDSSEVQQMDTRARLEREAFEASFEQWRVETSAWSDPDAIVSTDSYLELVGFGRAAVPWLFEKLCDDVPFLERALRAILRENPSALPEYANEHETDAWISYFTRDQLQNDLVEFVETRDRHDQGVQHNYHPGLPND